MVIAGAGGFAKQLIEFIVQGNPNEKVYFFDNVTQPAQDLFLDKYPILTGEEEVYKIFREQDNRFVMGSGNPFNRSKLNDLMLQLGGRPHTVISPKAVLGSYDITIEDGVIIGTNSIIENSVKIGYGALINISCTICHDSRIGAFSEIAPGVNVLGGCSIGSFTSVGSGAVILPRIKVGDNVVIGAGAVVTREVKSGSKVIGVPAREF